jgi:DNA-binding NarL/FixJ family response regulator
MGLKMKADKINVVLVEDHKVVRKGLRALLEYENDISVLGEAENGLEAIDVVRKLNPEVVIMDIALPKLNGIEASREIIKTNPNIKILMLSAHADDGYIEKALSLGIAGYLVKQCSPHLLIQAVREIAMGLQFYGPSISERVKVFKENQTKKNGHVKQKTQLLSPRETQVLQLIAEGFANKQVAGELNISIKTVEKHRQNVMKKLKIHDTAGLTRYAITEGIIENSSQKTVIS